MQTEPGILVIAGPNGSGKSTITQKLEKIGIYINADDIRKHRGCTELKAAEEAEQIREQYLKEKQSFSFETVLSTGRNIHLLERAKKAGYYIKCVFVLTTNAELNVFRVKSRVSSGGHNVPVEKIRSRYKKSLKNIPNILALCDECYIIDNTEEPVVVFAANGAEQIITENRFWSRKRIQVLIEEK
ncbi:ATPase AAA [Spirochaetia bacterium]|nr:ATPase AAA [Spirochaetia bacterium]